MQSKLNGGRELKVKRGNSNEGNQVQNFKYRTKSKSYFNAERLAQQ